ncbi:MAG TPA: hypothetical protein VIY96_04075 [Thermoanaerobaculia bacterium]
MEKARRSRGLRLATLLAAFLTTATSFGLHPEPGVERTAAPGPHQLSLPGTRAVDSGAHDCLACRAHRPLVAVSNLSVVPAPRCSSPRFLVSRPSVLAAFEPSRPDGRAPPDLS